MPRHVELSWEADPLLPGPRKVRAGFRYQAFVPEALSEMDLTLGGDAIARVSAAERAIAELNQNPPLLGPLEVLELSQRRLARAEVVGDDSRDETARSVLGNVAAMDAAISAPRSCLLRRTTYRASWWTWRTS